MAFKKSLILRKSRSGCLEGRTIPIQLVLNSFPSSLRQRVSSVARRVRAHPVPSLRPAMTTRPTETLRRENLAEPPDRAQHFLLRQPRPLAAHDEVIDTQQLAIPCDLVLHRPFIADDEPIAREI